MYKFILLILKVFLVFHLLALTGCESRQELEDRYIEKAQVLIDHTQYEEALIDLDTVLKLNPENTLARYLIALIAVREDDLTKAQSMLWRIIYIQPDFLDAQTMLGQLYLDWDEEPDWAMAQADLVLKQDNNNVNALNLKANVFLWQGENRKAEETIQTILQLDPNNLTAKKALVRVYANDKDFAKAISLIDEILEQHPGEIDIYLQKIDYWVEIKNTIEAEKVFQTLISKFPDNKELYTKFIEFYIQEGVLDKAEYLYRKVITQFPEQSREKVALISFLMAHGKEKLAEKDLKKFIEDDPENYDFQFLLADLYHDKPEQATKLLTKIAEKNQYTENGSKARNRLARMALEKGDKNRAWQLVEKVLEQDNINSEALLIRATLLMDVGKYSSAIRDLRIMIKYNPDSEAGLVLLANAHKNIQHDDLAKEIYAKVLKINPDNAIALKNMRSLEEE